MLTVCPLQCVSPEASTTTRGPGSQPSRNLWCSLTFDSESRESKATVDVCQLLVIVTTRRTRTGYCSSRALAKLGSASELQKNAKRSRGLFPERTLRWPATVISRTSVFESASYSWLRRLSSKDATNAARFSLEEGQTPEADPWIAAFIL